MEKSKFAINMGKLRRERGLSQRQAALELGVSQALLSHYETDAREPKLEFVMKVSEFYGVTTDYILGRTKERKDGATKLLAEINDIIKSLEEIKQQEAELIGKLSSLTMLQAKEKDNAE